MKLVLREETLDDLSSIYEWCMLRNPAVARAIGAKVKARPSRLKAFQEIDEQAEGRHDRVLIVTGDAAPRGLPGSFGGGSHRRRVDCRRAATPLEAISSLNGDFVR